MELQPDLRIRDLRLGLEAQLADDKLERRAREQRAIGFGESERHQDPIGELHTS
jgi:hypothetical protein